MLISFINKEKKIDKDIQLIHFKTFLDLILQEFKEVQNEVIAVNINFNLIVDLNTPVQDYENITCLKWIYLDSKEGINILRHSTTHVMAQAVVRLFKNVQCTYGPTTEDGFFYDFDFQNSISEKDFEKIEMQMQAIAKESIPFERKILEINEGIDFFLKNNSTYKVEILNNIKAKGITHVSLYQQGEFIDLCRGPHLPNTNYIQNFKLLKLSGVHWKNDSKKLLNRIYGTAFPSKKALDHYIHYLEELKKRDHRVIGKKLNLFHFDKNAPGFPFWHSKGFSIYNSLEAWIRKENFLRGYKEVKTPILLNKNLWDQTGHSDHFKDHMFSIDKKETDYQNYVVKPMNCPGHALIYNVHLHSYKDLPVRISEFGQVHRNELSGVLYGLFRVRSFTQDDGHVFCKVSDIKNEIIDIIEYTLMTYKKFGFKKFTIFIATKPKKGYIGNDKDWEISTQYLKESLETLNLSYDIKEGEAAFYGPKIEFNIKDSLNRNWQCGTIQMDFYIGDRLNLKYRNEENKLEQAIVIHRAILGSLERFIGILIEEYEGNLPSYLSPIQVRIITIHNKEELLNYAREIEFNLLKENIRVDIEKSEETLGYRIRKNELEKIPYLVILGDNELKERQISLRIKNSKEKLKKFKNFLEFKNYIIANILLF